MTICRTIFNIHTVICTALVRRIAATDESGIFNVHTVGIAVDSHIKTDCLGLVRRDLTERYGQGLAGIVVLIFCGVAVYGYIAAEGQSVRNGIGHNRVADIHIRTSRIRCVYGVGDRIANLGSGFVCGLGNGQQRVTVCDCYTIVLVLHRVCIIRGQRCKVLDDGVVRGFVYRCGKADNLLCIRLNRADIDGQQAGILIVGVIVGILAVQRDRAVFKGQSSRKNIGDNAVLNRNSCGIIVLDGQRVRNLIAHAGRGLVRRLVDLRLCLAVTNGYAVVLAAGVRRVVGLHHSGVVDGLAVCGDVDHCNESYRCAFFHAEITDLDGQNAGRFIIAVIVGQLAVQRNRAVLNIQSVRNSIGQHSVLDRYACELAVCQLDGVSHLIANIGSGLVRSLGDFRLDLAVTDLNALVLTLGVLDIITGEDSGVVYGLAVSRLIDGHSESYGAGNVRLQIVDLHSQLAAGVVIAVRIGLAIDLHAAVYEVKFSRNGICHFSVFDFVNSTVTVADLDRVGDLVTDICGFLIRSLGHIRRGIALFDIHAIVLVLVNVGFLAVRSGHITVRTLGNSGVVNRLIVHIAVDLCLESDGYGLASGNITEVYGQRAVLDGMGSRYIVHIDAALDKGHAGRDFIGQHNAFPCRTCFLIVRQLDRVSDLVTYLSVLDACRLFDGRERVTGAVLISDRADIAAILIRRNGLGRGFCLARRSDRLCDLLAVGVYEFLNDDIVLAIIVLRVMPFLGGMGYRSFHEVCIAPERFCKIVVRILDIQFFQLFAGNNAVDHAVYQLYGFGSGDLFVGTESAVRVALNPARFTGSIDIAVRPVTLFHIRENLAAGVFEVLETRRQYSKLRTTNGRVRCKAILGLAFQQPDVVQRFDRLIEPVLCVYILEGAV